MPWFWGSSKKDDDDYDDSDEEYSTGSEYDSEDDDGSSFESKEGDDDESLESEEEDGGGDDDPPKPEEVDEEEKGKPVNEEEVKPTRSMTTTSEEVQTNHVDADGNDSERKSPDKDEEEKHLDTDNIISNNTEKSGGSIVSVGVSLIDSEHYHSEDFADTSDDDDGNHSSEGYDDDDPADNNDDARHPDDVSASDDDDDSSQEEEEEEKEGELSDESSSSSEEDDDDDEEMQPNGEGAVKVSTIESDDASSSSDDDGDEEDEEEVTTFWEKQSLLVLAAEHDRVDILKAILTDEDNDRDLLMSSGVPPLHISISFGSTNATQSLLRMGADPSIRPNIAEIKQRQQQQAKSSSKDNKDGGKVEIPNMQRFDGISAWELAFGNQKYEDSLVSGGSPASKRWSLFGSNDSSSTVGAETVSANGSGANHRIIKPVDMAPSKREGIRHAFTAESLRCIGGDEKIRLQQLLDSGMPPTIDIGGKDLYGWAVEMGAMKCEELLRPAEAAKHEQPDDIENANSTSITAKREAGVEVAGSNDAPKVNDDGSRASSFRILDRRGQQAPEGLESILTLVNRLDELESLATALSTCLDNLAEEVSVCHGLLLMGGGASALAAHVKSLKTLQYQKSQQLHSAQIEWEESQLELDDLILKSGEIGKQVPPNIGVNTAFSRTESFWKKQREQQPDGDKESGDDDDDDDHAERCQLKAQIAASENKIRKLRSSIADLSDENTKEMEEVEKRGLSGGINLVRSLREEIRDTDYQLSEVRSSNASCRAKIGWINTKISASSSSPTAAVGRRKQESPPNIHEAGTTSTTADPTTETPNSSNIENAGDESAVAQNIEENDDIMATKTVRENVSVEFDDPDDDSIEPILQEMLDGKISTVKASSATQGPPARTGDSRSEKESMESSSTPATESHRVVTNGKDKQVIKPRTSIEPLLSERIAAGESQALIVRYVLSPFFSASKYLVGVLCSGF